MEMTKTDYGKLPWQANFAMNLLKVEGCNLVTPP